MSNLMQKALQLSANKNRSSDIGNIAPGLQSNTSSILSNMQQKDIAEANALAIKKQQQIDLNKLQLNQSLDNDILTYKKTQQGLGKPIQQSKSTTTDTVQNTKYTGVVDGNVIKYDIPVLYHGTQTPNRIVTHRTAGHGFNTPNDPRALKQGLAAHYTVTQDGKIYQIGDPTKKLWHAGSKGNNGGIGIEATGVYKNGAWEPLTNAQKRSLLTLKQKLYKQYHITQPAVPHYKLAHKTGTEGQLIADLFNNSI